MKTKNLALIIIGSLVVLAMAARLVLLLVNKFNAPKNNEPITNQVNNNQSTTETPIEATFVCKDNKTIQAKFDNQKDVVDLTLSDGRNLELPHAISADGARYANQDESFVFWNKGDGAFIEENQQTTFTDCVVKKPETNQAPTNIDNIVTPTDKTALANPASTNCLAKGGQIQIQTRDNGSQYGLCFFDDNRACEEWAMLKGDCPVGGVKTTGYDDIAQKFCAWSGGRTVAQPNAVCTFKDGSKCLATDFYNQKCLEGFEKKR